MVSRTLSIRGRTLTFVDDGAMTLDDKPVHVTVTHGEVVRGDDGTEQHRVLNPPRIGLDLYVRSDGTLLDFGPVAGPVKLQAGFFHPDKPGTSVFLTIAFAPGGMRATATFLEDAVTRRPTYTRLDWILRRVRKIQVAEARGAVDPKLVAELAQQWREYGESPRLTYPWPFPWPDDLAADGGRLTANMGQPEVMHGPAKASWGEAVARPPRTESGVLRDIFSRDLPPRSTTVRGRVVTVAAPGGKASIELDGKPLTTRLNHRRVVSRGPGQKPEQVWVTEGPLVGIDSFLLSNATLLDFGDASGTPVLQCGYRLADRDDLPIKLTVRFPSETEAEVTFVEDDVTTLSPYHLLDEIIESARNLQKLDRDPHKSDAWLRKIQHDNVRVRWPKYCAGPRWTYPWPFPWPKDVATYGRELTRDMGAPPPDAPTDLPAWKPRS